MKNRPIAIILLFSFLQMGSRMPVQKKIVKLDLNPLFMERGVKGGLVILDAKNNTYTIYNEAQVYRQRSPASTFKIVNTLIALETGIASDTGFTLPWDSIRRPVEAWNRDQTLRSAFQSSCVWYYQEIARRIGTKQMQFRIDAFQYGNADISNGADLFWIFGKLRISPMQQVDFLQKLHTRQLKLSDRTYNVCRQVMLADSNAQYTLRAKTGMGDGKKPAGWYVGYFETAGNVYYFANCISPVGKASEHFLQDRKDIVFLAMKQLGFLKP